MKLSTAIAKITVNEPLNLSQQIAFESTYKNFLRLEVRYRKLISMIDIDMFEIQQIAIDMQRVLECLCDIDLIRFRKEVMPLLDENIKSLIPRKEGLLKEE